jgi:hypothetical protein
MFLFFAATVEHMEDPYESSQLDGMEAALQNAISNRTSLQTVGTVYARDALALCRKDTTLALSHKLVLFLWFSKILSQLTASLWRFFVIMKLPIAGEDTGEKSQYEIRFMSLGRKLAAIAFGVGPRLIINLFIGWIGAKFLVLTHNMGSLILKAFGLSYLIDIDSLLFTAFSSAKFAAYLKKCSYVLIVQSTPHSRWHTWLSTLVRMTIVFTATSTWYFFGFAQVLTFKHFCEKYFELFPENKCIGNGSTCDLVVVGNLHWKLSSAVSRYIR